jgi:hypothetical protein
MRRHRDNTPKSQLRLRVSRPFKELRTADQAISAYIRGGSASGARWRRYRISRQRKESCPWAICRSSEYVRILASTNTVAREKSK